MGLICRAHLLLFIVVIRALIPTAHDIDFIQILAIAANAFELDNADVSVTASMGKLVQHQPVGPQRPGDERSSTLSVE